VMEGSKLEAIKEAESHVALMFEEDKKALSLRLEEKQQESDQCKIRVHELEAQLAFKETELDRTRHELEVSIPFMSRMQISVMIY
jgi:CYTH domain-containing protein